MANPIEIITKPVGFGVRTAFGAVRGATHLVQGLTGGGAHEQPLETPDEEPRHPAPPQRRPAQARRPAPRRRPAAPRKPPERRSSRQPKPLDDVAITRKVESVIFRSELAPKGSVDVNTAGGVVWLRGEAKTPEMIRQLEAQALEIPEVKRVENLLHLPHTPAPTRADTPASQQHTQRSAPAPAARKVTSGPITSERHVEGAEPSPAEIAGAQRGRPAAPLGSEDKGEDGTGESTETPPNGA